MVGRRRGPLNCEQMVTAIARATTANDYNLRVSVSVQPRSKRPAPALRDPIPSDVP